MIEREVCAICRGEHVAMVTLGGGVGDARPWVLCLPCYASGARSSQTVEEPAAKAGRRSR